MICAMPMAPFRLEQTRLHYLSNGKKLKLPVYSFTLLEDFCCLNRWLQEVLKLMKVFHKWHLFTVTDVAREKY